MIFVFFCSMFRASDTNFPISSFMIAVRYLRHHFEKCYSHWTASDYHLRDGLRPPIRLQEMLQSRTSKLILINN
jgi:hypothetical protein